jgi:glycerophosphoryl diester phosphodiesterase
MKKCKIIFLICLVAGISSCERVKYYPDNPVLFAKTNLIAHRGSGMSNDGNTLSGCINGFNRLDGIECDIQRSKENTIWLNHSPFIESCGEYGADCFSMLSDSRIIEIDSCLGNEKDYSRLDSVFAYMSANYPNSYISLDTKAWEPCNISQVNVIRLMDQMADVIISLTNKYQLGNRVLVESETGDFLYYIMVHSDNIATYLTTMGDFDMGVSRALDAGFTGISYKYNSEEPLTKEQVDLIHRKGLRIQIWTINEIDFIRSVMELNPDFIQTDNLDALDLLE